MSGIFDQIINYSPPLTVSGTVNYKGTWDASANSPTLNNPPAASTKGDYYVVSVAGTQFSISFAVGDWIISNGTAWEKVDLTDAVSSVFGRTGAVVGASTDYSSVGLTATAIGASSPSTGAFTTVTASSTIAATGAVTGSNLSGTHSGTSSGTNTGDQTITLTGGVTGSGTGSFAATVVTNANLTGAITSVGNATSLGSFSSANLASALTDETGSGANVFATSPTIVTPVIAQINDASGNETLKLASIASAVNEVTIENAATGNAVHITATGGDASVGLHLAGKGASGYVNVQDSVDGTKRIMFNAAGGTTNTRTMLSSTQTVDRTISLPDATDTLVGKATTDTLTNKTLTSPTLTTPILGTPQSGTLSSCTGLPISTGVSGLGTGIATALAVNVGTAGAPVVNGGALGTPSSGTVTNLTGTASININGTVGATTANTVAATTLAVSSTSSFSTSAPTVPGGFMFRNRIINGDMRIDQANAGAAASVSVTGQVYSVDQWLIRGTASAGVFSAQQSTSTPPAGFTNFLRITTTTADASPASGSGYFFSQFIEGLNCQDLQFGSAGAKTITISFWVRSSLTGSFSGAVWNMAANRCYPFSFTISSASTWEQKTITIVGDTTGTWLTDTGIGLRLSFDMGNGSTFRGTAGAWTGTSNIIGVTSAVRVISTLSATFDLTGVQLEVGSAATPFEVRDYATELVRCQRYYEKSYNVATAPATATSVGAMWYYIAAVASGDVYASISFKVNKRSNPIVTFYGYSGGSGKASQNSNGADLAASSAVSSLPGESSVRVQNSSGGALAPGGSCLGMHYVADARL